MSLHLMKERIRQSGLTLYDEQIKDAQNLLAYGFKDDISYNRNIVFYNTEDKLPIKMYDKKYNSSYGTVTSFLTPHSFPVEVGSILYDTKSNEHWLCVESYNVSDVHYDGKLGKCLRFLKWQDRDGNIQKIPIIVTSASKYNNGQDGNSIIVLGADQLLIFTQLNEHTIKLDRGVKFFIDENKEHPTVYKITRIDTVLYSHMGNGMISMIVTECAYNPTKEELELGVCNYDAPLPSSSILPENPDDSRSIIGEIIGERNIKVGKKRKYTVNFTDINGNEVDWKNIPFYWYIDSDLDIRKEIEGNVINLYVDDDNLISEKIKLQVFINNEIVSEIVIVIESVF